MTLRSCGSSSIRQRRRKSTDPRDARVVRHLEHPWIVAVVHVQVRDSRFRLSASSTIVLNLKTRNVRSPAPIRTCRKNTGPRESSLMSAATTTKIGARSDEPERGREDIERPLEESRRSREMRAGKTDERHTFDRVELCIRAEHLEHARDDVDLNVAVLHRPNHFERLIVRVGGEGDRDAVHTALAHEPRQIVSRSDQSVRLPLPDRATRSSRSTNPTTRRPYSGCFSILSASR